ncbi:Ribonuclease H2 subunit A [Erysiphe neolycopersici]|uniref:Ribonuclease n=1 Tax=Erysiphe neolycopersici TaxID=212602 RepID=A0A420HV88_9PEZI|nr:Ribonuclease H2 subunit A [Erysiphe neolycopersici]
MSEEFEIEAVSSIGSNELPISKFLVNHSIKLDSLLKGDSYSYFSDLPVCLSKTSCKTTGNSPIRNNSFDVDRDTYSTAYVLGVDEAGRGPVLGPMVYGAFYLPISVSESLLRETHQFDDSKILTQTVRSNLMRKVCTEGTDLHQQCGWAVEVMSARDISSNMMKPGIAYNLNAQAMDATIGLIKGILEKGVNVKEIYIDTIGKPETYQKKMEIIFPTAKITVAKKADSLYPCVSAASVCAKVTRDAALELLYENYLKEKGLDKDVEQDDKAEDSWGSGYPSDTKCSTWLRNNMHPLFGWGSECRFSWATAKDMLDKKDQAMKVDWPTDEDESKLLTQYFSSKNDADTDELFAWFGRSVDTAVI